jgi:hypothetical protein
MRGRRWALLETSGPEGSGFRKQREREDDAMARANLGSLQPGGASLVMPWLRSHERQGKGEVLDGNRSVLFARSKGSGVPFFLWTKKARTAEPGGEPARMPGP